MNDSDPMLRDHLLALGASEEQVAGKNVDELIGLAGDLQLAAGLTLDVEELARESGCSVDEVRSTYASLGLDVDDLAGFGRDDVAMMSLISGDRSGVVEDIGAPLMRVTGSIMARLAEAAVAAYVQDVEPRRSRSEDDLLAQADQNAVASALAVGLGDSLPTIFRHHMWDASRRQRSAQQAVASPEVVRLAVGFVDLVGFTSQSHTTSPAELIVTIESFEQAAFDAASRHGGRVVKSIGDEVMLAGESIADVAAIALDLVSSIGSDPSVAPRGGVSAGEVLFRLGDYYGPVVNLASRLVDEAVPGEVLIDERALGGSRISASPAGRRLLKGFSDPIEVCSVVSVDPPER